MGDKGGGARQAAVRGSLFGKARLSLREEEGSESERCGAEEGGMRRAEMKEKVERRRWDNRWLWQELLRRRVSEPDEVEELPRGVDSNPHPLPHRANHRVSPPPTLCLYLHDTHSS